MSIFDERFEFRLARLDEIDRIMEFNRKYWGKENHILAINKSFFEYEFVKDNRVGYFLAIDKENGEIVAAEGVYFYTENFIPGESDMSSGMFLANPECKVPLVGIELMKRKFSQLRPRSFVGPGVNINTSGLLYKRLLHQDVSRMRHFYMIADKDEYHVARIRNKHIIKGVDTNQHELKKMKTADDVYRLFDDESFRNRKPYKDRWYVTHRYFEHPIYEYKAYMIGRSTVLIGREISVNETKIFRIVDILGEVSHIAFVGNDLRRLINENCYEYIDIYELGMADECLKDAGFIERHENDENIIPNYFEPYECRNVEIYTQRLDTDALCFKADGDQDRPN